MFRFALFSLMLVSLAGRLPAQSPTPSASPKASPSALPKTAPGASPSPTLSSEELINSLGQADVQAAISLLKSNFTKPEAINETELNRATLQGLMARLDHGLVLLPDKASGPSDVPAPFYAEILEGHVGYLRLGSLSPANLQAMDKKLGEFAGKKVDALAIDLRSSSGTDFAAAADFAKRFCGKGKTLFTLRKQGKQDRAFTSDREPIYHGLIVILADADTSGAAEALATALRFHDKALIIGQSTAGRAFEYADLPLPSGKILRMAVSEAVSPDGHSLYPDTVKPDLPVDFSPVEKRQIFQLSMEKGLTPFIFETERPHLNEAALIAGTNPELESADQRRGRGQDRFPRDAVLQRALDLVTSLEIYQKR
jgi:hypothetical protein